MAVVVEITQRNAHAPIRTFRLPWAEDEAPIANSQVNTVWLTNIEIRDEGIDETVVIDVIQGHTAALRIDIIVKLCAGKQLAVDIHVDEIVMARVCHEGIQTHISIEISQGHRSAISLNWQQWSGRESQEIVELEHSFAIVEVNPIRPSPHYNRIEILIIVEMTQCDGSARG